MRAKTDWPRVLARDQSVGTACLPKIVTHPGVACSPEIARPSFRRSHIQEYPCLLEGAHAEECLPEVARVGGGRGARPAGRIAAGRSDRRENRRLVACGGRMGSNFKLACVEERGLHVRVQLVGGNS